MTDESRDCITIPAGGAVAVRLNFGETALPLSLAGARKMAECLREIVSGSMLTCDFCWTDALGRACSATFSSREEAAELAAKIDDAVQDQARAAGLQPTKKIEVIERDANGEMARVVTTFRY